jgi:hypothetical protein
MGIRPSQLGGPLFVAAGAPLFPPATRNPTPNSHLKDYSPAMADCYAGCHIVSCFERCGHP